MGAKASKIGQNDEGLIDFNKQIDAAGNFFYGAFDPRQVEKPVGYSLDLM